MKTIIKYSTITIATLLLSSTCMAENHKHESTSKHWGYTGDEAPKNWSKLDEKYHVCSEGTRQSPINVIGTNDVDLKPLNLKYSTASKSVLNNGHTIQVDIKDGSTFVLENDVYELKQFHFHSPSENNINGNDFPLEVHFVHATKEGKLAVIGVMFEEGAENAVLSKIWKQFPLKNGEEKALSLSVEEISALMPYKKDYYTFMGSLTTPPCSENVKWHIYKTPIKVSKAQVDTFFKIFGHATNRPIQKNNSRVVTE